MTTPTKRDVRTTWEQIGPHFAATRATPWPEVETFTQQHSGAVGLDIGTGNGRHAALLEDRCDHVIGLDVSTELLHVAKQRLTDGSSLVVGDATDLPFHPRTVDVALSIATIHHLPTEQHRKRALTELARVLTHDARALISVWCTEHDRFDATTGFDTTLDWTLPDGSTVDRFYHIFDPEEFRDVLSDSPLTLLELEISSGNCYATVTR